MKLMYSVFCFFFRFFTKIKDEIRLSKQEENISDLKIQKDIFYVKDNNEYHKLDIIRRKEFDDERIIVDIHGGGLMYGDKELNRHFNYRLARKGYVVISLSYRLIPNVGIVQQLKDCFDALSYLDENCDNLRLTFDKFYIVGDSAGGLLTYLIASINANTSLMKSLNFEYKHFNILSICTISCMSSLKRKDNLKFIIKVALPHNNIEIYNSLYDTPLLISSLTPSWIMFTSDNDMIRNDSYQLKKVIEKNNIELEFYDYETRTNKLEHVFPVIYPDYKESKDVINKIDSFFKKHS